MKSLSFKIASLLVAAGFAGSASAAPLIGGALNNGNFEAPDVASPTNFILGTITDWSNWGEVDTVDNDTGVYDAPGAGSQDAYIQPGGAIRNMTTHVIAVGDVFNYGFTDVLGVRGDATMQLVYDDGGVITAITGSDLVGDGNTDNTVYSDSFTVLAGDAWVGSSVGVGLFTNASYPEVDDVTLDVVPEPGSLALLGLGGLALLRRRRA